MIFDMKQCNKCREEKILKDFYLSKGNAGGYKKQCKSCFLKITKEYAIKNLQNRKNTTKKYRKENKEKLKSDAKKYRQLSKNHKQEYQKKFRKTHKGYDSNWVKERCKKDSWYKLQRIARGLIRRVLKHKKINKDGRTFEMLRYSNEKLKQRMEVNFKEGMNWNNYGKWHIDHKKPVSKFKEGTPPYIINILSNLQPLWKEENLTKGNRF